MCPNKSKAFFLKKKHRGVGMLEFVVALTVFTTVAMALLASQIAGKRIQFDALQRSRAIEMANDLMTKIQSNSGAVNDYVSESIPDPNQALSAPGTNCRLSECSSMQLAKFDLWMWERELRGALVQRSGNWIGGLLSPLACVGQKDGLITIVVSWEGVSRIAFPTRNNCGSGGVGLVEPGEGDSASGARRQQVVMTGLLHSQP